jgi:hypothetical protein
VPSAAHKNLRAGERKMKKSILFPLLLLAGCSHAKTAKLLSNGQDHHIIQFSGGQKVGEWTSNGRVYAEDHSDGYYFETKPQVKSPR